jgi:ribosome-binding protein aMBF1 (putative translation factor)
VRTRSMQKKATRSAAERARIRALREKYKARPTPEQLLASGDYTPLAPLGVHLQIKQIMHQLKDARAKAGLSLADLAQRTQIDRGYLSKLENMQQANTTLETVSRIADALGLEIHLLPAVGKRK